MILNVAISVLVSMVVYFSVAAALIISGKPKGPIPEQGGLVFKGLFVDYAGMPQLETFTARDGARIPYRHYPTRSDKVVILLHGSGSHSRYFFSLGKFLSSEGLAQVFTPDLRGHGYSPEKRGDVHYIGQLEDDLEDFIAGIRRDNPESMIIVGGHSSGGGLAIRFAGRRRGPDVDAYLLLSPYLKYNAPTVRPNSGGWARAYTRRIIGLTLLNNVGIRWFNGLTVIDFNMPMEARDGTETLSYSYRLNTSYAPREYEKDLRSITQPLLVVVGSADEAFYPSAFEPVISRFTKGRVELLPGVTHIGAVISPVVRPVVKEWLQSLRKP